MKSLMLFWKEVLDELGTWCDTSTTRDFKTVSSRFEHEGWSFFGITLPSFAADFEKGLERGSVDHDLFSGFHFRGGLPQFLGGFLDLVFDRGTGRLLDEPDVDSIYAIRQLTLMFGKILVDCSLERQLNAISKFIECEKEVRDAEQNTSASTYSEFADMSATLWSNVLAKLDEDVWQSQEKETIVPKHGPGSTAERILGNQKYVQLEWPTRLEALFPYLGNAAPNERFSYLLDRVDFLEPGNERPVRIVLVPKTLKTPRVIAIEPVAMMYLQQGISEKLVEYLETDSLVKGMIGFSHQEPNQLLAKEGSLTGKLATLDLSEASDRVSNQLVRVMTRRFPWVSEALDATRSRRADVPGVGVVRLAKYASMGSALCFPVEAMVFLTIVMLGIQDARNRRLTRKDVQSLSGQVRVYGDDIIVPVDCVDAVIARLEAFGLKVNSNKSFWKGKFRESCGKDYYAGTDVSIVRVRRVFPTKRHDVQEMVSLVSLRNQMYFAGLWRSAGYLDDIVRQFLPHFPIVEESSPALGRHSASFSYQGEKLCDQLHVPLVKAYVTTSKPPVSTTDGEGALVKWFTKRGTEPFADVNHLERQGRPETVYIKLRWTLPY